MAAPTRKAPQRISKQGLLARTNDSSTIYSSSENSTIQTPMVISQPGKIRTQDDINLEKFAQLIMYIVALIAIWGGIFSIAFDDNATNSNFLILKRFFIFFPDHKFILQSYKKIMKNRKNTLTPGSSQPEVFNVLGQLVY